MALDPALLDLAADRNLGVLSTIKRDGRPQLSMVSLTVDRGGPSVRVSVTDGLAKVANLRRDPRASVLIASADGWSYAVLEGTVALSPVAAHPHDATVRELVEVFRLVQGREHPDWDDYRRAMVQDRRLVATLHVEHTYGLVR